MVLWVSQFFRGVSASLLPRTRIILMPDPLRTQATWEEPTNYTDTAELPGVLGHTLSRIPNFGLCKDRPIGQHIGQ